MRMHNGARLSRICLTGAILVFAAAAGCKNEISTDDVVSIDSTRAIGLVKGKSSLLGLSSSSGAWIDPRPTTEFNKGHIPGAINIPFADFEDKHKTIEGIKALVVYGDDYNDWRAEAMAKRLLHQGVKEVRVLEGGLRAWTAAGNAVEQGG